MTLLPFKSSEWTPGQRVVAGVVQMPVRILCLDGPGTFPVIGIFGGEPNTWDVDGVYNFDRSASRMDLKVVQESEG